MRDFGFLEAEWTDLHGEAARAERLAQPDPRAGCFYARRIMELAELAATAVPAGPRAD